ncbi:unnamed protein product [Cochlearia groenlandica]
MNDSPMVLILEDTQKSHAIDDLSKNADHNLHTIHKQGIVDLDFSKWRSWKERILARHSKKVVTELKSKLLKDKLLVSVAATIKFKDYQVCTINGYVTINGVVIVMSLGTTATKDVGELVSKLFGSVRKMLTADEKMFDAVIGPSGSGPTYIYLAIETLADGGVAAGL